jgi:predicted dinucleotide-binding enzyme
MAVARVVKALNTVFMSIVAKSAHRSDARLVIFVAGHDTNAKATVSAFIDSLGLAPIGLGTPRQRGRLMQVGGPLNTASYNTAPRRPVGSWPQPRVKVVRACPSARPATTNPHPPGRDIDSHS